VPGKRERAVAQANARAPAMRLNLALFGATGNLGRHILREVLERGHRVTAFARSPEKLGTPDAEFSEFVGDARNLADVTRAIQGRNAVVSALGPSELYRGSIDDVLSAGTKNLVSGMAASRVARIVAVAESGILQADPKALRLEGAGYPSFLRPLAEEHRRAYETLKASDLDWTLVCPPRMLVGPRTGHYLTESDYFPKGGGAVFLEDVGRFHCG